MPKSPPTTAQITAPEMSPIQNCFVITAPSLLFMLLFMLLLMLLYSHPFQPGENLPGKGFRSNDNQIDFITEPVCGQMVPGQGEPAPTDSRLLSHSSGN
jgi:hypothetical protein